LSAASGGFVWPVRVYLEDTDAQGVVYNASYFRFMERARTEWLRARGIDHDAARARFGISFVLTAVEARFRAAAKLSDLLEVTADVSDVRGVRIVFTQRIRRAETKPSLLCEGKAEVACMDASLAKPRRWPDELLEGLTR
jgi:tol-pal system-associated acyl-CoA thioesterase